jgi:hypothetical protein
MAPPTVLPPARGLASTWAGLARRGSRAARRSRGGLDAHS